VHLVGFTIEICYVARSYKRKISQMSLCALCVSLFKCFTLCSVPFCSRFTLCCVYVSLCALCHFVHVSLCDLRLCVHIFGFVLCAIVFTCFALCFVPVCSHVLLCAFVFTCFAMCFVPLCSHVLLCLPYLLSWRGQNQSLVDWTFLSQCDSFVKQTRRFNPTYEINSTHT